MSKSTSSTNLFVNSLRGKAAHSSGRNFALIRSRTLQQNQDDNSSFLEILVYFGFMFALIFFFWTLFRFLIKMLRRSQERERNSGRRQAAARASITLPIMEPMTFNSPNDSLSSVLQRERRAFVEGVLLSAPYNPATVRSNACAICLDEYKQGDCITQSFNNRCQHLFHRQCAVNWFSSLHGADDSCPCCRQNFLQFDDGETPLTVSSTTNPLENSTTGHTDEAEIVVSPSAPTQPPPMHLQALELDERR